MTTGSVGDRRRDDRRGSWVRLADYPLPELRRAAVTFALLVTILGLFAYMVKDVLIAAILGLVVAVYLIPFHGWLRSRLRNSTLTAIITITLVTVPVVGLLVYSWLEISDAAEYLEENRAEVTSRLTEAIHRLPYTQQIDIEDDLSRGVAAAANQTSNIVGDLQEALGILVISIAVFLFTVFYLLTDHRRVAYYLRSRIPGRYRPLARRVAGNIRAVVYGSIYATFLTQIIKSGVILGLNLMFGVPLAFVLAILSFFIGFFPIVGSWSVYVPVAIYLMVFQEDLAGGVVMLLVGFFVNTLFMSMYLRPKIAAEKSHVLNFYWMFIALVTGVYTFGLTGIVIGPVLIGVLKAVFETVVREVPPRPAEENLSELGVDQAAGG